MLPLGLQNNWLRNTLLWHYLPHIPVICSAGVEWGVLEFDESRMCSHVDVSLLVVFQRNAGPATWGFSPVHQWAAYRSGHTRHLQVHTYAHIHIQYITIHWISCVMFLLFCFQHKLIYISSTFCNLLWSKISKNNYEPTHRQQYFLLDLNSYIKCTQTIIKGNIFIQQHLSFHWILPYHLVILLEML